MSLLVLMGLALSGPVGAHAEPAEGGRIDDVTGELVPSGEMTVSGWCDPLPGPTQPGVSVRRVLRPGPSQTRVDARSPVLPDAEGRFTSVVELPEMVLPGTYRVTLHCRPDEVAVEVDSDGVDDRPTFVDVVGAEHREAIRELARRGVARGCSPDGTLYCPRDPLTRAAAASLIVRLRELSPSADPAPFDDVDPGSVHAAAIATLAEAGVVQGCGERRFCPDRPVRRDEMATLVIRAFGMSSSPPSRDAFSDVHSSSPHAIAVATAEDHGVTEGCAPRRFCPGAPVSRAQGARWLHRAADLGS